MINSGIEAMETRHLGKQQTPFQKTVYPSHGNIALDESRDMQDRSQCTRNESIAFTLGKTALDAHFVE